MLITTKALFVLDEDNTNLSDELSMITGDVVTEVEKIDGVREVIKYVTDDFVFDMNRVTSINKSTHEGYTVIRVIDVNFSIAMPFDRAKRLFHLCRG